jgi:hypothetical protein
MMLLVACGKTATPSETPEAVHARWIAAVRANDRAAALALMSADAPQRDVLVDQALRTMRDLTTSPSSPTGALLGVDLLPMEDASQGKRAISVWRFAQKTWCYQTDLRAAGAEWRVVDWGQIAHCPS